jgi:site-specific DNA-methyltransferase (adenine-specific)
MSNKNIFLGENQELVIHSFKLQRLGLTPLGDPTYTDWQECGAFIRETEKSVQFWIGDWLNFGEKQWGKRYEEGIQQTGLEYQTLRDYKWVAAHIPVSYRNDKLSYHHHREVASLPPEKQVALLQQAASEHWSLVKLKQEKYRRNLEAVRIGASLADPDWLLGDCTKLLERLPDNSIDLLLTDPPYGTNYLSDHREVHPLVPMVNDKPEETLPLLDTLLSILTRKLKINSHLYIFTSWRTYPFLLPLIESRFTLKNLLVWEKNNWTAGDLDADYGKVYELILFANYEHVHELVVFAQKGRRHLNGRRDTNVLHFKRVPENVRFHPTEKPIPLLEYLIEKSSQPGEVVCDPFAGVASTCIAAKNTGRKYIGIEISEHWHKLGLERLASVA